MVGHSLVACLHLLVPVIREDLVVPVGLVVQGVVGFEQAMGPPAAEGEGEARERGVGTGVSRADHAARS